MRVAILYSGQLRRPVEEIKIGQQRLYDAVSPHTTRTHVYTSTWETENVSDMRFNYIFPEPKYKYKPGHKRARQFINVLRSIRKNKNTSRNEEEHILATIQEIKQRNRIKNNYFGHIGHAMMLDRLNRRSYDVIIRARYDTYVSEKFTKDVPKLLKIAMNYKSGIGCAGQRIACLQTIHDDWESDLPTLKACCSKENNRESLPDSVFSYENNFGHDHLIIHRKDSLPSEHLYHLVDSGKMTFGETGWWQWRTGRDDPDPHAEKTWTYHGQVMIRESNMINIKKRKQHIKQKVLGQKKGESLQLK